MEKRKVKDLRIGSKVWIVGSDSIKTQEVWSISNNKIHFSSFMSVNPWIYENEKDKTFIPLSDKAYSPFAFCNIEDAITELRKIIQKQIETNNQQIKDLLDKNLKLVEQLNSY